MKYTSLDKISRRLRNRIQVITEPLDFPVIGSSVTAIGGQQVDPALIEDIAFEVESEIDNILAQIYELPLQNEHGIITSIATNLICSELLTIHFQGLMNPVEGGDQGFGALLKRKAEEDLIKLTAGHNIYVSSTLVPPQNNPGFLVPQPVFLAGEIARKIPDDTLSRNINITAKRNTSTAEQLGVYFGDPRDRNKCTGSRAMGSERPYC